MVFWFLNHPAQEARDLAENIIKLKEGMRFCRICHNLSEAEICMVCNDTTRDHATVCVVENPKDLLSIERTGAYKGLYHVLLGTITPIEGRGPEDLTIQQLLARIRNEDIKEVIIATNPDNDGEITSLYLTKQLAPMGVRISRIGVGLPVGSALEYADASTLSMSLMARREIFDVKR